VRAHSSYLCDVETTISALAVAEYNTYPNHLGCGVDAVHLQ